MYTKYLCISLYVYFILAIVKKNIVFYLMIFMIKHLRGDAVTWTIYFEMHQK